MFNVSDQDFNSALVFLKYLTTNEVPEKLPEFSPYFESQNPIVTAIEILHNVTEFGASKEQQAILYRERDNILALNNLLKDPSLSTRVTKDLGIEMTKVAKKIQGLQIAPPLTNTQTAAQWLTAPFRAVFAGALETGLMVGAIPLIAYEATGPNWNPAPDQIKTDKDPILLLHGKGFNQAQFILGREYLKMDEYGSVFSLNYAESIIGNDSKTGIEQYAEKVRDKIEEIKAATGRDNVIIIGHSMGGLVGSYYAEYYAEDGGVSDVITIGSPWKGAPLLELMTLFPVEKWKGKQAQQMRPVEGEDYANHFLKKLGDKARASEFKGKRNYYNIFSEMDYAVPGSRGVNTLDPSHQCHFTHLAHNAQTTGMMVWRQVQGWLNQIYEENKEEQNSTEPLPSTSSQQTQPKIDDDWEVVESEGVDPKGKGEA